MSSLAPDARIPGIVTIVDIHFVMRTRLCIPRIRTAPVCIERLRSAQTKGVSGARTLGLCYEAAHHRRRRGELRAAMCTRSVW